jgi:hypothetical protein
VRKIRTDFWLGNIHMEDQETEGIVTLRWILRTGDEPFEF